MTGKVFLYATMATMLVSALTWLVGLGRARSGKTRMSYVASAMFALAGLAYYATVAMTSTGWALNGFVHHEGFVVVGMLVMAPLIGLVGGIIAIVITLLVSRVGKPKD